MVFALTELTDRCKIVLEIPIVIIDTCKSRPYKWTNLKPSYKWDKNSASKFKKADFNLKKGNSETEEFCSSVESNNADIISHKLHNIFHTVCRNSLETIKPVKPSKNTKKKDKLWYDKRCDLNEMKKNISLKNSPQIH